jgi:hypothetical protein
MNRLLLFLIAGLCVMTTGISVAQEKPLIPLPSDPSTPIITMDRRGGYVSGPRNVNPILTIRADGRVIVVDPWGKTENRETVLSSAEIQELLRFAITEQDFFAFDASHVRQAIEAEFKKAGGGSTLFDYPDTIVHIRTANQEHEASYNALANWAQWYPNIKSLVQLRAIEVRLTKLVDEVKAGPK